MFMCFATGGSQVRGFELYKVQLKVFREQSLLLFRASFDLDLVFELLLVVGLLVRDGETKEMERHKKRWRDKIQEDLKTLKLKKEDADDRNKWRRRIRVADPSPR